MLLKEASDELEADIEDIIRDDSSPETDKISRIKTRIGQGDFRNQFISYWKCCAVTVYKNSAMLIASHIKPWRDSNNQERLDKYNGLLFTPNFDKAFDNGFISFDENGKIMISNLLKNLELLGLQDKMRISSEAAHKKYLDFHRESVYLDI